MKKKNPGWSDAARRQAQLTLAALRGNRASVYGFTRTKQLDRLADYVAKAGGIANMRHHNAIGHALGVAIMTKNFGADQTRSAGLAHELISWSPKNSRLKKADTYKDMVNNEVGIQIGQYARRHNLNMEQIAGLTLNAYWNGQMIKDEGQVKLPANFSPSRFNRRGAKIPQVDLFTPDLDQSLPVPAKLRGQLARANPAIAYGRAVGEVYRRTAKKNVDRALEFADAVSQKSPLTTMLAGYVAATSISGRLATRGGFHKPLMNHAVSSAGGVAVWGGIAARHVALAAGVDGKGQVASFIGGSVGTAALVRRFGSTAVGKFAAPIGIGGLIGETASDVTKSFGGSKAAQKASFWGTAALVAGGLLKIGARANPYALAGSLALSVGQHFYHQYKSGQDALRQQRQMIRQKGSQLAGKTPAQRQKIINGALATLPTERQSIEKQAKTSILATGGGTALMLGSAGAAMAKAPNVRLGGRAGVLTGLAVALYGLMMGGDTYVNGQKLLVKEKQQRKIAKAKRKKANEVAMDRLASNISAQMVPAMVGQALRDRRKTDPVFAKQVPENVIPTVVNQFMHGEGFHRPTRHPAIAGLNPPSRTDTQLEQSLEQLRSPLTKMARAGGESTKRPASSASGGDRHVWDDKAREAAALARHVNAAHKKVSKSSKKPARPARKTKPRRVVEQPKPSVGEIKVTRVVNGKTQTYTRKRSAREK